MENILPIIFKAWYQDSWCSFIASSHNIWITTVKSWSDEFPESIAFIQRDIIDKIYLEVLPILWNDEYASFSKPPKEWSLYKIARNFNGSIL